MGLVKKFKAAKTRRQCDRVNDRLEKLADALPEMVAAARRGSAGFKSARRWRTARRGGVKVIEIADAATSVSKVRGLRLLDAKTLPAYRRLHEVCAAADVSVKCHNLLTKAFVSFNFETPYKKSPDAWFFAPKKPVAVQPASPG